MNIEQQGAAGGLNAAVAAEIRAILARRGWRQSQLADKLGVKEMWVSRRLRGVNAITVDDLERIARGLGIKPANLLGLVEHAATQGNSDSLTVADQASEDSFALAKRPIADRTCGGPRSSGRRPERVVRQPMAA